MLNEYILSGIQGPSTFSLVQVKKHAVRCAEMLDEEGFTIPLEISEIFKLAPYGGREYLQRKSKALLECAADFVREQEIIRMENEMVKRKDKGEKS